MKKEKTIHIRVSDTLYDRLSKSAETCETNVSAYSRKVLKSSVKIVRYPFKSDEFLHMAQWLFTVRDDDSEALIFDARHYLKIIEKYYPYLDAELQELLENVIKDLKAVIKEYKMNIKSGEKGFEIFYQFGQEDNEVSFDYDTFQKYF